MPVCCCAASHALDGCGWECKPGDVCGEPLDRCGREFEPGDVCGEPLGRCGWECELGDVCGEALDRCGWECKLGDVSGEGADRRPSWLSQRLNLGPSEGAWPPLQVQCGQGSCVERGAGEGAMGFNGSRLIGSRNTGLASLHGNCSTWTMRDRGTSSFRGTLPGTTFSLTVTHVGPVGPILGVRVLAVLSERWAGGSSLVKLGASGLGCPGIARLASRGPGKSGRPTWWRLWHELHARLAARTPNSIRSTAWASRRVADPAGKLLTLEPTTSSEKPVKHPGSEQEQPAEHVVICKVPAVQTRGHPDSFELSSSGATVAPAVENVAVAVLWVLLVLDDEMLLEVVVWDVLNVKVEVVLLVVLELWLLELLLDELEVVELEVDDMLVLDVPVLDVVAVLLLLLELLLVREILLEVEVWLLDVEVKLEVCVVDVVVTENDQRSPQTLPLYPP
ncbi:unnamed protein product [Symbiodinium sp. CCMP2456]|nr:unnamed protein product [Symbiodinium sp. CCMP2456]